MIHSILRKIVIAVVLVPMVVLAQQKAEQKDDGTATKYALTSNRLDAQEKELDNQINDLNGKIADLVKRYDLLNTTGIRVLPYQTEYRIGDNYIEIEKHVFTKDHIYRRKIAGIKTKKLKIWISGKDVTKFESEIFEKNFDSGEVNVVYIVDPSPATADTSDIVFTHIYKGEKLLDGKNLGEVKNTTAHPVRNEIKQTFLIPHLNIFYNSLLFTVSSYYKSLKDADSNLAEFLKQSIEY